MTRFQFQRLAKWRTGGTDARMELSIPLPTSEAGLVHRWCPNEECQPRRFQLGDTAEDATSYDPQRQRRNPGTAGCTCPYCGRDADDADFTFPGDEQAAVDKVQWAVMEDVGRWMEDLARDFNRAIDRGGDNLLNIKMTSDYRPHPEPRPWREDLLRAMECHLCSRSYGVYAIALFCPDCGAANLANHFEREVALVIAQVDLAEELDREGVRELAFRLLGNAHEDVVTAFETYLKSAFRFSISQRPEIAQSIAPRELRGNPFQNLERASSLFDRLGVRLLGGLEQESVQQLATDFEKRHVVGHNLGLVDEKYTEVAADATVGETVQLLGTEVETFAETCLLVVSQLESALPELHP